MKDNAIVYNLALDKDVKKENLDADLNFDELLFEFILQEIVSFPRPNIKQMYYFTFFCDNDKVTNGQSKQFISFEFLIIWFIYNILNFIHIFQSCGVDRQTSNARF